MPHAVTHLTGFAAGGSQGPIEVFIGSSENNVNLFSKASAVGDPSLSNSTLLCYLANGVVIGSSDPANPAMESGSGWGSGSTIKVIVTSGNIARIQGAGAVGGSGRKTRGTSFEGCLPITDARLYGGGGGAGTVVGAGGQDSGNAGTDTTGGAAIQVGPGECVSTPFAAPIDGGDGGHAIQATNGEPDITLAPEGTGVLQVWGGGGAGGSFAYFQDTDDNDSTGTKRARSGAGGDPGESGEPGDWLYSNIEDTNFHPSYGGANGRAYYEPGSASVVEDVSGGGTIDARGFGAGVPEIRVPFSLTGDNDSASHVVSMPSTRPDGALYIMQFACDGSVTITWPGGWTEIDQRTHASGSITQGLAYRYGSSEPATYTVTISGGVSQKSSVHVFRIERPHPTTPVDVSASSEGTSTTPTYPSVTTTVEECLIMGFSAFDQNPLSNPWSPSGWRKGSQHRFGGTGDVLAGVSFKLQHAAGATGSAAEQASGNDEWITHTIALQPAP